MESYVNIRLAGIDDEFMDVNVPKDGTIFRISFEKCPHDPRWVRKGGGTL